MRKHKTQTTTDNELRNVYIKFRTNLTKNRELIIGEKSVGLVQQKITSDKLLKTPIFALHESVGPLALHGFGFFPFRVEDAELKLRPDLALVARHQQEVQREVVFAFFI